MAVKSSMLSSTLLGMRAIFTLMLVMGVILVVMNNEKISELAGKSTMKFVFQSSKIEKGQGGEFQSTFARILQHLTRGRGHMFESTEDDGVAMETEHCECKRNTGSKSYIWRIDEDVPLEKREVQWREFEKNENARKEPMAVCPSLSPLTFAGSGLTVEPLHSIRLLGLSFHPLFWSHLLSGIRFRLGFVSDRGYGTLSVNGGVVNGNVHVTGSGTSNMVLDFQPGMDHDQASLILSNVVYTSTQYDTNKRDIILVKLMSFTAKINIHVYREYFPRLYNHNDKFDITEKVTIVTKTFERYEAVLGLIESIRKFYPNITILVADDSEHPQSLDLPGVMHYIMPFAEGWFAGRNLLVSQVQTEYFLWVDDDFLFTESTSLENMLAKLQNKKWGLDIVSGLVESDISILDRSYSNVLFREKSQTGYCLKRQRGGYPLEGSSSCQMADEAINFFMAKTLSVRSVGFTPDLPRFGHHDFFWDGLGKLRVAACNDFSAFHARKEYERHGDYRYQFYVAAAFKRWMLHPVYRNYLNCFNWDEYLPDKFKSELKEQDNVKQLI